MNSLLFCRTDSLIKFTSNGKPILTNKTKQKGESSSIVLLYDFLSHADRLALAKHRISHVTLPYFSIPISLLPRVSLSSFFLVLYISLPYSFVPSLLPQAPSFNLPHTVLLFFFSFYICTNTCIYSSTIEYIHTRAHARARVRACAWLPVYITLLRIYMCKRARKRAYLYTCAYAYVVRVVRTMCSKFFFLFLRCLLSPYQHFPSLFWTFSRFRSMISFWFCSLYHSYYFFLDAIRVSAILTRTPPLSPFQVKTNYEQIMSSVKLILFHTLILWYCLCIHCLND